MTQPDMDCFKCKAHNICDEIAPKLSCYDKRIIAEVIQSEVRKECDKCKHK